MQTRWKFACWLFGLVLLLNACAEHQVQPPTATNNNDGSVTLPSAPPSAENFDRKPFLRLETGMHIANINGMAVDRAERYLVTASDDKTARVWALHNRQLLQILRPPIGDGSEGRLYAVAISPDGKEVAVGGFTGRDHSSDFKIYFFDRASGQLTRSIGSLPDVIFHLAYSHDGRYLAASLAETNGIRLYDVASLTEIGKDSDYGDASFWLDFGVNGRLVSSSRDGYVRLYDRQLKLIKKVQASGGKQPYAVAFSPDGEKIAVGFHDNTAFNVLFAEDLHLLYAPDSGDIHNGHLSNVTWSKDGQQLYAGGRDDTFKMRLLVTWSEAHGVDSYWERSLNLSKITGLIALSDGHLAYVSDQPVWGILSQYGPVIFSVTSSIADYRNSLLWLGEDATQIAVNSGVGDKSWSGFFDLRRQNGIEFSSRSLAAPLTSAPGLNIDGWKNTFHPTLNGQALTLEPYERSHSLAIAEDGRHFLLGTERYLRYYNRQGQELWRIDIPGAAWAVNLSANSVEGRWVVAALGDGTIRWYRYGGVERLALFVQPGSKRWVLWTPEGFYSASPDAEELIGYHLNQGVAKESRFVSMQQLRRLFYRPDLIAQRLQGSRIGGGRAPLAQVGDVNQVLQQANLPPHLELIDQKLDGEHLRVRLRAIDRGGGIGKLRYLVNGIEQTVRPVHTGSPGLEPVELTIPLPKGRNAIDLIAGNRDDSIASEPLKLQQTVSEPESTKPALYVLAVGVTLYSQSALNLQFADRDAEDLSAALQAGSGQLFGDKQVKVLTNAEATKDNIRQQFAELASEVQPNDVFVLFLAGHGKVFDGQYFFIPNDAIYSNEQAFRNASVDEDTLRDWLGDIKAQKSLLLLDTCYSGKMTQGANLKKLLVASRGDSIDEKAAISRLNRATGRAILAATSDQKLAFEGYNGHGYFTAALLEGLKRDADADNDRLVNVLELSGFLSKRVPTLSNGYQIPVLETEKLIDFPLGVVNP